MNAYRIRPLKYPWPMVFYLLAVLGAWGLNYVAPLQLLEHRRLLLEIAGAGAVLLGLYLVSWASISLYRNRRAAVLTRSSTRLVIRGPFRFTRNPIYLGYTVITLGAALYFDNAWMLLSAVAAVAVTHLYVVRKQEMHLLARFGYEFERYCRRTRAWI
jgi:protein-S-isoprenylcysteine O-methyltransferase Ste14